LGGGGLFAIKREVGWEQGPIALRIWSGGADPSLLLGQKRRSTRSAMEAIVAGRRKSAGWVDISGLGGGREGKKRKEERNPQQVGTERESVVRPLRIGKEADPSKAGGDKGKLKGGPNQRKRVRTSAIKRGVQLARRNHSARGAKKKHFN